MRVVLTDAAREDLISIGNRIAENNPLRAFSFIEDLETHCFAIGDFPHSYAALQGREETGIRRVVHGNHGIFYTITEAVNILYVLNSAMDYERILFPEE